MREERARRLIAVGRECALTYHRQMVGQVREVLFEEHRDGESAGYTREYVLCRVPCEQAVEGMRQVRVTGADAEGVTGELV